MRPGRSPIASVCALSLLPRLGLRDIPMTASAICASMPSWWHRAGFRVISPRLLMSAAYAIAWQLTLAKYFRAHDESEHRRTDGPDRADQHPRRFHLCAAAGSAKTRPHHRVLHPGPAGVMGV